MEEVDNRYSMKMQGLMSDNTDLRYGSFAKFFFFYQKNNRRLRLIILHSIVSRLSSLVDLYTRDFLRFVVFLGDITSRNANRCLNCRLKKMQNKYEFYIVANF